MPARARRRTSRRTGARPSRTARVGASRARRLLLPADADDDAVRGLLRLDLHDAVARAGEIRQVAAFGDDSVEADRLEPLEPIDRLGLIARGGRELEAPCDSPELRPALRERLFPDLLALPDEDIEGDEARRDLRRQLSHAALGRMQPHLHGVEVEHALALDHDLAVERGLRRQELRERLELGEVAEQRPRVPRPEPQVAARVLEQAAEAVPLRLVLPLLPLRELANELAPPSAGRGSRDRDRPAARRARCSTGGCANGPWSEPTLPLRATRLIGHATRRRHGPGSGHAGGLDRA